MVLVATCVLCVLAAGAGVAAQAVAGATTDGTEIEWEFPDSKGNLYAWSMSATTHEEQMAESRYHIYRVAEVRGKITPGSRQ